MRRRRALLAAAAAVASALPAAHAHAQVAWQPCPEQGFQAFQCARVGVPIDRSGGFPGAIELAARRLPAPANPSRTALVFLSGGPGQAASGSAPQVAVAMATGLRERDLLVFDQRGTGASAPLSCRALRSERSALRRAEGCANEIGPQRAFFRTPDSVADIEDLRAAAGYEKLVLYGVSYGTKVALAYAARHPDRVEGLVLDSVVTPEGPDPLRRSTFAASARVLTALCRDGACRGVTADPVADLRRLVQRGSIRGRYVDPRGRVRPVALPSRLLLGLLEAGDTNPAWRALLPAALRSAVLGDEAPLLRLASASFGGGGGSQAPSSSVNRALYTTTVCEELPFPWDRAAPASRRVEQATAALNALPPAAFGPFNRATGAEASLFGLCLGWPHASPPPEAPGALPRVPALLLSGETDLRTPAEDAFSVAERLGAEPVVVPHTGHSVLGSDFSGCARAAVAAFFNDGSTRGCPSGIRPAILPVRRPPRSLAAVPQARRYKGRVGRTLNAVGITYADALVAALGAELAGARRVGGVRRGTIALTRGGIALRGVELVPGVRVTGTLPEAGSRARLRVTGRAAARGRLTITRAGTVTGRLGGRRIRASPRAAAVLGGPFARPPEARALAPFPGLTGG